MYQSLMTVRETQIAIKEVKTFFEDQLAKRLELFRVSAPLFVTKKSGLNDHLNGVERPIEFDMLHSGEELEIVHSLAKWKRFALHEYGYEAGEGLYTNMNAIRRDEELDATHSIYVDQWDWEKIVQKEWRTVDYLQQTVQTIYGIFKDLEDHLFEKYPFLGKYLPEEIVFVTSQELEDKYPELSPKDREHAIAKEHGAVFIIGIGDALRSGEKHDGRAADYDDWKLNGDILFWHPVLQASFELSSMGIRVDSKSLDEQLTKTGDDFKREYDFHKGILEDILPLTIGGGIGQSRMCMYFLRKAHIGEVQSSVWPDDLREACKKENIHLF
ncbi:MULTISPECIES: aspartate--ammonia ligase [Bacillus]|uniref:aspartate--ammonia ligase n=1 Tax=Bacillus TaxID=1386 RepID=UPI001BB45DD1|nr:MULTISPECIES: aspartate--ammonia ligase [Bacillus]